MAYHHTLSQAPSRSYSLVDRVAFELQNSRRSQLITFQHLWQYHACACRFDGKMSLLYKDQEKLRSFLLEPVPYFDRTDGGVISGVKVNLIS